MPGTHPSLPTGVNLVRLLVYFDSWSFSYS